MKKGINKENIKLKTKKIMKKIDLSKLFGSKCRTKILEKYLLEYTFWNKDWFYMRALSRDIDEQINSVKRELDSLKDLWFLHSKYDAKKKIFYINKKFYLLEDFKNIFLKSYSPLEDIKKFLKQEKNIDLAIINDELLENLESKTNNIVDILLIWDIDKPNFALFLEKIFFNKKIKYAILSKKDFYDRIEQWDQLIYKLLKQRWNLYLYDKLWIKVKLGM